MSDINIYENQAAIDALTPISGDLVVDRGTSTLHLCTGTSPVSWKIFTPDENELPPFAVDVYDTEEQILALTDVTDYTIAFAKDTDSFYIWDGTTWYFYDNNSIA